tara:strand:+ start:70 stop:186 length:117 start_codon:yes stop_codon:yes gene_type:complete
MCRPSKMGKMFATLDVGWKVLRQIVRALFAVIPESPFF